MTMTTGKRKRSSRADEVAWNKRSRSTASRSLKLNLNRRVRVRPSLQIQTLVATGASEIGVRKGGTISLLGSYSRGSDESQRHTSETMTYKVAMNYYIYVPAEACKYSNKGLCCIWLIYDAQPNGAQPAIKDIFAPESTLVDWPHTWAVSREVCHRFVIKRRYTFTLETNGRIGSDVVPANTAWYPCNKSINFTKFAKGLGVKTEWKNDANGDVGSIKKGALYIAFASGNGVIFNVMGRTRLYFKSVGNQ
uniref:Capsid protein n=1 Tax=Maize streak dwarfing virus TaxID=2557970 RepID=A0A482G272_9GEMI|nr:coat protein [Maize streak dwarfing virus]QBO56219.1 coat protein [Maize streak dwarfing virus]QBO56223.1 coat protein [Maize streak dwarfing virus]